MAHFSFPRAGYLYSDHVFDSMNRICPGFEPTHHKTHHHEKPKPKPQPKPQPKPKEKEIKIEVRGECTDFTSASRSSECTCKRRFAVFKNHCHTDTNSETSGTLRKELCINIPDETECNCSCSRSESGHREFKDALTGRQHKQRESDHQKHRERSRSPKPHKHKHSSSNSSSSSCTPHFECIVGIPAVIGAPIGPTEIGCGCQPCHLKVGSGSCGKCLKTNLVVGGLYDKGRVCQNIGRVPRDNCSCQGLGGF